jgi:hypothetical protein
MDDFFDMGDFDIGFGAFGSSCTQITDPEDYPAYRALWSCGLRVRGAAVCVPGKPYRVLQCLSPSTSHTVCPMQCIVSVCVWGGGGGAALTVRTTQLIELSGAVVSPRLTLGVKGAAVCVPSESLAYHW